MELTNKTGYSVLVKQTATHGDGKREVSNFEWHFKEDEYEKSHSVFTEQLSAWSKHAGVILYTKLSYTIQHLTHHVEGFDRKVTISNNIK